MKNFYILRPGNKLFFERDLALNEGQLIDLPHEIQKILKALSYRPLWEKEFFLLPETWKSLLKNVRGYYDHEYPLSLEADYEAASISEATAWKIIAHEEIIFHWGVDEVRCKEGHYFFPYYRPDNIDGAYEIYPLKSTNPSIERDQWILDQIKESSLETVLELGSGEERLYKKIQEQFPNIVYKGMDIAPVSVSFKGDFLVNYPEMNSAHIVILEEVIEHLNEADGHSLLTQAFENGAREMIITTPNKLFTQLLGRDFRHPDHKFEWDRNEVQAFAEKLQQQIPNDFKIQEIGKKLKGITPTWGLIIKFRKNC